MRAPRRVFVRDMEILASIGIFEVEQGDERRIIPSLDLEFADNYDGVSARMMDVLDYSLIVRDAELLIRSSHFKLIETLANFAEADHGDTGGVWDAHDAALGSLRCLRISMSMPPEPNYDVAQLGHIELWNDTPEASLDFFVNTLGLAESRREGDSVYLRAYDDYEFYTLSLTAANTTGMRHVGYRCSSAQAVLRRIAAIEKLGAGIGWTEGDLGHGPAYQFRDPDDHIFELYDETKKCVAPPAERPALKNQAQRNHRRGIGVRRFDHFNLLAVDLEAITAFMPQALGGRITEQIVLDSGKLAGSWFTHNNKSYDVAFTLDSTGKRARFHHVTYALDQREHILEAADIFLKNGVFIEAGPHKHAIQQTFFLNVYEPAGNRAEVANDGACLILAPDWETVIWIETERKKGQAWGLKTIESFHTQGTPPVAKG